jgi:DNA-binding CsgD family transcriptional regulator
MNAAAADSLASLIGGIGTIRFPTRFLTAMHALARVDLCSVFRRSSDRIDLVFAEEGAGQPRGLATAASVEYMRSYWRSDTEIVRAWNGAARIPIIVRRKAADILDPAYREACYGRVGVDERVSIVDRAHPGFVINGYRTAAAACFSPADLSTLQLYAGMLLAAIAQHHRAVAASGDMPGEPWLVGTLLNLQCGLSAREAEISAALILGDTQDEIARRKHLTAASVITYRRRAYAKLGVGNRRDLLRLHRSLLSNPHEGAASAN